METETISNAHSPPERAMAGWQPRVSDSYPMQLHVLKALCVTGKYRQCIQACRQLLESGVLSDLPLQQTFVNFYLGLAHDELARMMHHHSRARLPAFGQAQHFYRAALDALPSLQTLIPVPPPVETPRPLSSSNDRSEPYTPSPTLSPSTRKISGSMLSSKANLRSPLTPPPMSPTSHNRTMSLPLQSPHQPMSREASGSTLTDLESHSSFDQILTPHKAERRDLSRDFSRMSLLDEMNKPLPPPPPQSRLGRSPSMIQGLLRPIRQGSPPRQYHVPPRLPYARERYDHARLPKLVTQRPVHESPTRRPSSNTSWYQHEETSPVSPVSPMEPAGVSSGADTVSPVSPETPVHAESHAEKQFSCAILANQSIQGSPQQGGGGPLSEHLEALRTQLQTHLILLTKAESLTLQAQSERATPKHPPSTTNNTSLAPLYRASMDSNKAPSRHDSLQEDVDLFRAQSGGNQRARKTRSYWSFTPVDEKVVEKRRRIEEGRARGWKRERFQAEKYEDLVARALAEL